MKINFNTDTSQVRLVSIDGEKSVPLTNKNLLTFTDALDEYKALFPIPNGLLWYKYPIIRVNIPIENITAPTPADKCILQKLKTFFDTKFIYCDIIRICPREGCLDYCHLYKTYGENTKQPLIDSYTELHKSVHEKAIIVTRIYKDLEAHLHNNRNYGDNRYNTTKNDLEKLESFTKVIFSLVHDFVKITLNNLDPRNGD